MRYEWDEEKNWRNQQKHGGISFEMGALIFEDERCLVGLNREDETGEQRWQAIGRARIGSGTSAVLFVVHVYREDIHGEEIVRIVSARRAEKHELRRYQEQAMD
ncbi:MAG: BrnT family toxin [Bryobacteraceae bacterium]